MIHPTVAAGRPVGARAATPGGSWVYGASLGMITSACVVLHGFSRSHWRLLSSLVMARTPRNRRESLRALPQAAPPPQ